MLSLSATSTGSVKKVNLEAANVKPADSRLSTKDTTNDNFVSALETILDDTDVSPVNKTMSNREMTTINLFDSYNKSRTGSVSDTNISTTEILLNSEKKELDANKNMADGLRSADNEFKPSQPWRLDKYMNTHEYAGE